MHTVEVVLHFALTAAQSSCFPAAVPACSTQLQFPTGHVFLLLLTSNSNCQVEFSQGRGWGIHCSVLIYFVMNRAAAAAAMAAAATAAAHGQLFKKTGFMLSHIFQGWVEDVSAAESH